MANKRVLILFSVLGLVAFASANKYLKQINTHLIENEMTDNLRANFKVAKNYLDAKRSEKFAVHTTLTDYLDKFLRLQRLEDDDEKCTSESFEIVRENQQAVAGREADRLTKLVHKASARHNKECAERILTQESAALARVHPFALTLVEEYTNVAIQQLIGCDFKLRKLRSDAKALYKQLVKVPANHVWRGLYEAGESLYPRLVFDSLRRVSQRDPIINGNFCHLPKDKLEVLFTNYIVKPCELYTGEMVNAMNMWKISMDTLKDEALSAFTNGHLVRYQVCDYLINKDKTSLFESLRDIEC